MDYVVYGHAKNGGPGRRGGARRRRSMSRPDMPGAYQDLAKVEFVPARAPVNPASTAGLVTALRRGGPRTYLITTSTQVNYLEEAAGYACATGGSGSGRL